MPLGPCRSNAERTNVLFVQTQRIVTIRTRTLHHMAHLHPRLPHRCVSCRSTVPATAAAHTAHQDHVEHPYPGEHQRPHPEQPRGKHNAARVQMRVRANKRGSQRQGRYQAQPPPWAPETGTEAAYLGPVRRGTASAEAAACPLNFCETSCCARDFPHGHAKARGSTMIALVTV